MISIEERSAPFSAMVTQYSEQELWVLNFTTKGNYIMVVKVKLNVLGARVFSNRITVVSSTCPVSGTQVTSLTRLFVEDSTDEKTKPGKKSFIKTSPKGGDDPS